MTHTVAAQLDGGEWIVKQNTHYNFDAENGVLYMFDDDNNHAYLNFDKVIQVGCMPEVDE